MTKLVMLSIGSCAQDVFLAGDIFTPECKDEVCYAHFKLGDKLSVDEITFATGGNAMNAAVTFARQGMDTHMITLLGNDLAGKAVLEVLDNEAIHTSRVIVDKDFRTSYSTVLLSPGGERTILNYQGEPMSSRPKSVSAETIVGDWLYVSSVGSMPLLKQILQTAHQKGIKVAFNPASFELDHVDECADLLQYVTIFGVNKDEAALFTDGKTSQELARSLVKTIPYVLVSDGPNGAVATDGRQLVSAGMYEDVPVIDRTGAGDAFTSGFTVSIAQGKSLQEALLFASANSTSVVGQIGAEAGILHSDTELHDMPFKIEQIAG